MKAKYWHVIEHVGEPPTCRHGAMILQRAVTYGWQYENSNATGYVAIDGDMYLWTCPIEQCAGIVATKADAPPPTSGRPVLLKVTRP